jgi:hypothetical protein
VQERIGKVGQQTITTPWVHLTATLDCPSLEEERNKGINYTIDLWPNVYVIDNYRHRV